MKKEETYKLNFELNKDEIIKDLKEIKKEFKSTAKEIQFDIKKLKLKRKDILVIKLHGFYKAKDIEIMKKQLEKQLHRNVLLIDDKIDISHVISYKKK